MRVIRSAKRSACTRVGGCRCPSFARFGESELASRWKMDPFLLYMGGHISDLVQLVLTNYGQR